MPLLSRYSVLKYIAQECLQVGSGDWDFKTRNFQLQVKKAIHLIILPPLNVNLTFKTKGRRNYRLSC